MAPGSCSSSVVLDEALVLSCFLTGEGQTICADVPRYRLPNLLVVPSLALFRSEVHLAKFFFTCLS